MLTQTIHQDVAFAVVKPDDAAVSRDGVAETDFGNHEFATLDRDGNLVTFEWVAA